MYRTRDLRFLLAEYFNRDGIVNAIIYYKVRIKEDTPCPVTQEDVNELQPQNLPEGTHFPDEPDTALESGAKFWVSTDGKYYIQLGSKGYRMAGMELEAIGFYTPLGYIDVASTANELETAHIETHEK